MNFIVFAQVTTELSSTTEKELNTFFKMIEEWESIGISLIPKIILAFLLYLIGAWLIRRTTRLSGKILKKRDFDVSLQTFLTSIIRVGLTILLIIVIVSVLGIDTTSFAALLAGAGLAIGSALNGTLGNFAGGVMLLVLKPFKVGDLIEAQNQFGIVSEIGIVYSTVLTSQNKTIRLPNGALSTGVITNYTDQDNLRIDIRVPIADYTNVDKATQVAVEAMQTIPEVLDNPAPDVKITELTGDGPVLVLWPRIKIKPYNVDYPRQVEADYYSVYFGVRKAVYDAFVKNNIQTPSSTLEVTMMKQREEHRGFEN